MFERLRFLVRELEMRLTVAQGRPTPLAVPCSVVDGFAAAARVRAG
ncbi:MAG: hypothetical protein OXG35_07695 [Acidobacteria bacterium]|nr:hypothetical protein [Acidobacteriota bacterium]